VLTWKVTSRGLVKQAGATAGFSSFLGLMNETGPNGDSLAIGYDTAARPTTTTSPYGADSDEGNHSFRAEGNRRSDAIAIGYSGLMAIKSRAEFGTLIAMTS